MVPYLKIGKNMNLTDGPFWCESAMKPHPVCHIGN